MLILSEILPNIKFIDYTSKFKKDFVKNIKEEFRECALGDEELSDRYKEHVKNLNNILVDFNYQVYVEVNLKSISTLVSFDYDTYEAKKYVTGRKVTIRGNLFQSEEIIWDDEVKTKYVDAVKGLVAELKFDTKSEYKFNVGYHFLSDFRKYSDAKKYDDLSDLEKRICDKYVSVDSVHNKIKNINTDGLIDEAKLKLKKFGKIKNVKIDVVDYEVNSINILVEPNTFDVYANFNGKKYVKKDVVGIDDIGNHNKYSYDKSSKMKLSDFKFSDFIPCFIFPFYFFLLLKQVKDYNKNLLNKQKIAKSQHFVGETIDEYKNLNH